MGDAPHSRRFVALLAGVVATGCAPRMPPASVSFAKHTRPPDSTASHGKVGAGIGGVYIADTGSDFRSVGFPVGEGSVTFWPTPAYGVALTAANLKLGAEGVYFFGPAGGVRIGIVHGVGAGGFRVEDGDDLTMIDLGAGLLVQVPLGRATLFGGGKYALTRSWSAGDAVSDHYAGGAIGAVFRTRGLELSPEIVVASGWLPDPVGMTGTTRFLVVLPMLTFAGAF